MLAAALVERFSFAVAAVIVLLGACGVIFSENPVHSALSLVGTLFGVALMFVIQGAYFLAAIQVIVYAGAIVILFLFVIMLLGVDRFEVIWGRERQVWRRPLAVLAAASIAVLTCIGALATTRDVTGRRSVSGALDESNDVMRIGEVLFTRYVWAFEITGVLLTVAVVGAVVLSRKPEGDAIDLDEFPEPEPEPEPEEPVDDDGAVADEAASSDETDGAAATEPAGTDGGPVEVTS